MYFDHTLFKAINSLAGQWVLLDTLAIFCAEYLIFGLVLFLIYYFYSHGIATSPRIFIKKCGTPRNDSKKKNNFKHISLVFISLALVLLINKIISLFHFRPRPFITHPEIYQLIEHSSDKSFPSDHTAIAFALAMSFWFLRPKGRSYKKWGTLFLVAAVLIGLARIFCGLHYPLDVVVGAGVGIGIGVVLRGVILGRSPDVIIGTKR